MDKAKAAVQDFMSKAGHHDTTVHETVAPAVTEETLHTHRHEENQTAIDREIHQNHYHTSVQPIHDKEKLEAKHHHNLVPIKHQEFHHGNDSDTKARLEEAAAQFQNKKIDGEHRETSSVAPVVAGEHIHHHVHETIQPIVHREVVEPHVVHTTVPIHEVHHNEAQHHATSALPAVSMADFKKQGGVLTGRDERNDGFEGEPRAVGTGHHNRHHHHHHGNNTASNTGTNDGLTNNGINDTTGTAGTTGINDTTGTTGRTGLNDTAGTSGTTGTTSTTGTTGTTATTTAKNPSLLDRVNPLKDTDGDGKRGVLD